MTPATILGSSWRREKIAGSVEFWLRCGSDVAVFLLAERNIFPASKLREEDAPLIDEIAGRNVSSGNSGTDCDIFRA